MLRRHVASGSTAWAVVALGWLAVAGPLVGAVADSPADESVTFSGRVIEKANGRPVAGAAVVVTRSLLGGETDETLPWVGDTTLRTDADGRFTITFPPEQQAEPRLRIALSRVAHPDFVARKGSAEPLMNLLQGRKFGDKPFFDTVTLERGMEYFGRVVTPEGKPAADVLCEFQDWGWMTNQDRHFADEDRSRTDAEGRFRIRMPKTRRLAITVLPEAFAPFLRFWGTAEFPGNPDVWVPADLGRLVLEPGPVLTGRLLNLQGRPIAGQRVVAIGSRNGIKRRAVTDSQGRFAFAPLRPGNYLISAAGQVHGVFVDSTPRLVPALGSVIRPARLFLKKGETPAPVELRELPSVRVEVRFVDPRGQPGRGGPISLDGTIPSAVDKAGGPFLGVTILASEINKEEREDPDKRLHWGCQLAPDRHGRVTFRVPRGLTGTNLSAAPPDETIAFQTRLERDGPLKFGGGGALGTLDADRDGITIVSDRAPTVLVTVKTADSEPLPQEAGVYYGFQFQRGSIGARVVRQADGRFRTQGLLPDQEYFFAALGQGYVPNTVERLTLPEGAVTELTLILKKQPLPLLKGDPAPGFLVKTLDGEVIGLPDFRGRFLLLHFWKPDWGAPELSKLQAVRKRFGKDRRFAMLGLCLTYDPAYASPMISKHELDWPQAVLRDGAADPITQVYGGWPPPKTFLIGPESTILATDLKGDQIEEAVAQALGRRK